MRCVAQRFRATTQSLSDGAIACVAWRGHGMMSNVPRGVRVMFHRLQGSTTKVDRQ
jgi:hypothetical protein